jgi:ABC-2 type transport system permease protein
MGGFSFAGGQPQNIPRAAILEELEKQYDVEEVDPTNKIEPGKFDVLLVVQPSSMGPAELDNLIDVVKRGQPTAVFEDPLPVIDEMRFVPGTGQPKRQNPMSQMFGGGPPPPKGDVTKLWQAIGVEVPGEKGGFSPQGGPSGYDAYIIWQRFNPYKKVQVAGFSNQFVFIRPEVPGTELPFNANDPVTSGIEELLFPMPGAVSKVKDADVDFEPLVQTGDRAGTISFANWQANQENPSLLQLAEGPQRGKYVIAARVKGKAKDAASGGAEKKDEPKDASKDGDAKAGEWKDKPLNVIYVSDIDLMASAFVRIRAQPDQMFRWRFENVTFALNVIDALSGDDAYLDIRKRKTKYSTLTVIEKQSEEARTKEQEERTKFEEEYSNAIKKAEGESKELVKKFEDARTSIDERKRKGEQVDPKEEEAIAIQLVVQSQLSQQRLDTERDRLKRDRDERIKEAGRRLDQQIDGIQDSFKVWAVTLPLIPPLLVGLTVFVRRRLREREGISKARLL